MRMIIVSLTLTALFSGCQAVPIVKSLLAKGADVEAMDSTGFTALMYADARGHVRVIEVLLQAGARVTHSRLHSMPPEKEF